MRRRCRSSSCRSSSRWRNVHAGRGIASNHYAARDLPEDARGLLPDVAPPLRVPAARLRRVPDLLRLLQEGLSGDQRPDHRAHGGRHRGGDLPSRRGAAAPGALRGASSASTRSSRRGVRRRRSCESLRARAATPGRQWLEELATSRDPWFNINVGDGFYHYHRSWNDDLSMPFAGLPGYIAQVQGRRVPRAAGRAAAGASAGS